MNLAATIRTIPDHPKSGIQFRDITTLLADAAAFRQAVSALAEPLNALDVHKVAAIEHRRHEAGAQALDLVRTGRPAG